MRTWIISDTHFGHANILKYEAEHRPFANIYEYDEALVALWNSVVGHDDCVWHLGDVLFGEGSFELLGRLRGRKKLVLGNHDGYPYDKYKKYFTKICAAAYVSDALLTHVPVHPSQLGHRARVNVHGHLHSKRVEGDDRYRCVSVEQTGLGPVLLSNVIAGIPRS